MLFNIILGSIMGVSLIGLIVCGKKQHDNSTAKPLALLFMAMILVCGVVMLIKFSKDSDPQKYVKENLIFQESSAYVLAEFLSQDLAGSQVIVLLNKSKNEEPNQKALIEGLEKGMTTKDIIYLTPKGSTIPKNKTDNRNIMECVTAKEINSILSKYPKCKILITLIGLPKDLNNLDIVQEYIKTKKAPLKIGFLNASLKKYHALIKAGFISAATTPDPAKKYSIQSPSSDLKKTFDLRFLLITPQNVDQIAKQFPKKIFRGTTPVKNN